MISKWRKSATKNSERQRPNRVWWIPVSTLKSLFPMDSSVHGKSLTSHRQISRRECRPKWKWPHSYRTYHLSLTGRKRGVCLQKGHTEKIMFLLSSKETLRDGPVAQPLKELNPTWSTAVESWSQQLEKHARHVCTCAHSPDRREE